jgi:hypothetical protein
MASERELDEHSPEGRAAKARALLNCRASSFFQGVSLASSSIKMNEELQAMSEGLRRELALSEKGAERVEDA